VAVYTQLTHDEVVAYLSQYALGELRSFAAIAEGVTNTNYLLQTSEGKYILTLFEKHYKLEELPYFTALMGWWHARGIDCPQPMLMRDGRTLGALAGKPALVVSFLDGAGVETITPEHVGALGTLAATMHISGMEFPHTRANGLSLSGWEAIIDRIAPRLDEIEPGLKRLVSEEYNYLSENWPDALPRGPVHADLFPDNVFFTKLFGKPARLSGVIDFYFSCNDMWAYDLAIIVCAWCFDERGQLVKERVAALMQGYNDVRPLSAEEETAFPLLLRGASLRFLLTRADAWLNPAEGALVKTKDPLEYAAKLRFFQEWKP
jgi:homoserine kinase type II